MAMRTRLDRLADHGQSVWIDFLSRDLLRGGKFAHMIREDAVSGVTSNPTIFANALAGPAPTRYACSISVDRGARLSAV
jgi:transaldolase